MVRLEHLGILLCLPGLWVACTGEKAARRPNPVVVAVLPLASVGTIDGTGPELRNQMATALGVRTDATVLARREVDNAVDRLCGADLDRWDCLDKSHNLFLLGRELKVGLVVAAQLAAMGDRRALKLRVADVGTHRISTDTFNANGNDTEPFLAGLLDVHRRLTPQPPPAPSSWQRHWETWTFVGTTLAVVAGAVVAGVLFLDHGGGSLGKLDFDHTLP